MPLDPDVARALTLVAEAPIPVDRTGAELIAAARRIHEDKAVIVTPPELRDHVASVQSLSIPSRNGGTIAARLYRPDGSYRARPGVLWLHGGGWVTGSLNTADTLARAIAAALDAVVVSIDYRLAPEHPWPAALEDASDALQWLAFAAADLDVDADRIVIGGDSAGGNLAAVIALDDDRPPLAAQLLLYPAVDLDSDAKYPSRQENATDYGLSIDDLRLSFTLYPAGHDVRDPRLSPIRTASLEGAPVTVLAVAEFDPLRDEAYAYASRLRQAHIPTTVHDGLGLVHGCFDMLGVVPRAKAELDAILGSVQLLLRDRPRGTSHV